MGANFEFKAQDMETMKKTAMGTSKIRSILGPEAGAWAYQGGSTLCLGQLKTLFGEPLYMTKNLEDQYAYCILAAGEDGREIYLQVYSGPSGPSIGGNQDPDSAQAADELAKLIVSAKAADYDYEGYYMDGPSVVREGVRGGEPYMEEEELDVSEDEFARICEEIYGRTL